MAETLLQQAFDESREKLIAAICKLKRAKRLEYVESTGTQYIDTGVTNSSSINWDVKFQDVKNASSGNYGQFGARTALNSNQSMIKAWYGNSSASFEVLYGTNVWAIKPSEIAVGSIVHAKKTGTTFYANGLTKTISGSYTSTEKMLLFGYSNGGTPSLATTRIYFASFYSGSTPVRDFIPVKDSAGVAGLLDLVSGQIFYSATSTQLLAGPEATPYFSRIEYLESTGTQYVDTGIYIDTTTAVDINATVTSSGTQWLFGVEGTNRSFGIAGSSSGKLILDRRTLGANRISSSASIPVGAILEIEATINSLTLNGVTNTGASVSLENAMQYAILFGYRTMTGGAGCGKWRVSRCTISKSGVLVRDFMPVRIGTDGYLFDKVTHQFFGNSGTGSFVLGPDVA